MLRFFRQIRQRLITNNRFSKYLLYAIGEILLVVIGILIALSIDNWNEERKNNILKKSYIENLVVDLNKDVESLEELNIINTFCEKEGLYLAQYLDGNLQKNDTIRLANSLVYVGFVPNATIASSTYKDIIESNNISLFEDVELKKSMDSYYIENEWERLLNDRIITTAWYQYRDEMLKYHSPVLYQDIYASGSQPLTSYKPIYDVKWNHMKNNKFLKTQVGMLGSYRILLRRKFENRIEKAKDLLNYLEQTK